MDAFLSFLLVSPYFLNLYVSYFYVADLGFGYLWVLVLGIILLIAGILIWLSAITTMGKFYTIVPEPKGLVDWGIYSKIRHPIYLGLQLGFFALALIVGSLYGFLFSFFILMPYHIFRAKYEERLMTKKFGEIYKAYKKITWL